MIAGWLAFLYFAGKALDIVSPLIKWFVFSGVLLVVVLIIARRINHGMGKYRNAIRAYARRDIDTASLPSTFCFITHDTTLQDVINQLGPASRIVELGLRHSVNNMEYFKAYEYLPYSAAVIVMPQGPFEPADKIRAVYMRKAPADGLLSVES